MRKPLGWTLIVAGILCCNPPIDIPTEEASLLEADRAFDRATAERGVEGWVSFFTEEARQFPAGMPVVQGHAAIRELMAPALAAGRSLRWEPEFAVVSGSGDFGYTSGIGVAEGTTPEGEIVQRFSRYVTIWEKQSDGSWKVVADLGVEAPAPEGDGER